MNPSTQKLLISAATSAALYVAFFGIPFENTIRLHNYNRQVLKARKMRYKHEEEMARLKQEQA